MDISITIRKLRAVTAADRRMHWMLLPAKKAPPFSNTCRMMQVIMKRLPASNPALLTMMLKTTRADNDINLSKIVTFKY